MIAAPIANFAESALRSLLVALAVWAGLRIFRIGNVLAQKAAWGLVLAAALLMPFLAPLAARWQHIPAGFSLTLPAQPFAFLAKLRPATPAPAANLTAPSALSIAPAPASSFTSTASSKSAHAGPRTGLSSFAEPISTSAFDPASNPAPAGSGRYPAPTISYSNSAAPASQINQQPPIRTLDLSPAAIAWMLYAAVAAALFFRLAFGLAAAIRLWLNALPVPLGNDFPQATHMHLRASPAVASPVTIGSAVVLPEDYAQWDAETLRIVLAHERSHIRQGDFYLQLLAGLYICLTWPSPLGWWIKRELSDLAEAISDRAGLEQAASHSTYAQILLQFAATPRPTILGVAMARPSSLSRRIERLLSPNWFRQAFEGTRRRALLAVLLVPAALFAATAMIRVEAASQPAQAPAAQPAPPAQSEAQPDPAIPGPAHPEAAPVVEPDPAAQAAPSPAPAPPEPAPRADNAPYPATPRPPNPPNGPGSFVIPDGAQPMPPTPPNFDNNVIVVRVPRVIVDSGPRRAYFLSSDQADGGQDGSGHGPGYSYHWSNNGDSYAFISGDGREHMTFSGNIHTGELDKARKIAHGNFLWFEHGGKSYVVDDPAIVARLEAMYAPIDALGKRQEELGRQQEILGRRQEALGRKQEQVTVNAPDISKEMAEINASMAKLQAKMGKTVTMDELANLQGQLGDLQGRLGALQGEMGSRQGEFGDQQGKLGEEQGRLGEEQGKLGAEQGRLSMEADKQIKSIIDQTVSNGKARPVQ